VSSISAYIGLSLRKRLGIILGIINSVFMAVVMLLAILFMFLLNFINFNFILSIIVTVLIIRAVRVLINYIPILKEFDRRENANKSINKGGIPK